MTGGDMGVQKHQPEGDVTAAWSRANGDCTSLKIS
jgi:hypothetical protein